MGEHSNTDYLVVGSGAAGATVALEFTRQGYSTTLFEEGDWITKESFTENLFGAVRQIFREFGSQMAQGCGILPILQGSCVGGTTVMNGAIIHRLPEEIHRSWESKLKEVIPYETLEGYFEEIERDLRVRENIAPYLPQLPISRVLDGLGWKAKAMTRNAPGCEYTGRCLQGCPTGGKWSMERSYIPQAIALGLEVLPRHRVLKLLWNKRQAIGVQTQTRSGELKNFYCRRGVILASGVIQTAKLLWRSGWDHPNLGKYFRCHLGVAATGYFPVPVKEIEGPPQGIEILEFKNRGIKLATQLVPPELILARSPLVGRELRELLRKHDQLSTWTASIHSLSDGELNRTWTGTKLKFSPRKEDLERVREGIFSLCQLLFKLGAKKVYPGIMGTRDFPLVLHSMDDTKDILKIPLVTKFYVMSAGHLFGTATLGSEGTAVDLSYRPRETENLFIADASLFPSALGVNPQHSIMALARCVSKSVLSQTTG